MCLRNHYSMRQGLLNMLPHQKLNTTLKCLNFVLQVVDIFCFNASGCSDSGSKDGRRPPKMVTKSTDPGVQFQTLVYYSQSLPLRCISLTFPARRFFLPTN